MVVCLGLGLGIGGALWASGRTLGDGIVVRVRLAGVGNLYPGADVRLAGRVVGEVRGARVVTGDETGGGSRDEGASGPRAELSVFVARAFAGALRRNSLLFVATPSLLGQPYLEIGPPAGGAAPGPPLAAGEVIDGVAPPDIGRLLAHSLANIRAAEALLHDCAPEMAELRAALAGLAATWRTVPHAPGAVADLAANLAAAFGDGAALGAAWRSSGGGARVTEVAADVAALGAALGPSLRALGASLDRARERLGGLAAAYDAGAADRALARLRHAVAVAARAADDARALADLVARGDGTLGGLMQDRELFDDIHETHGIIKQQPWRVLIKPGRRRR